MSNISSDSASGIEQQTAVSTENAQTQQCAAYSCKSIKMDENEFPHSRLITEFVTRVTRQVPLVELERAYISVEPEFIPGF